MTRAYVGTGIFNNSVIVAEIDADSRVSIWLDPPEPDAILWSSRGRTEGLVLWQVGLRTLSGRWKNRLSAVRWQEARWPTEQAFAPPRFFRRTRRR